MDSEQALTSGICTGLCFRAIRIVNGFRDAGVRQWQAFLSFGLRLGEATGHGGGGVVIMKRLMKLLFVEFEFEFELMTGHVGQPSSYLTTRAPFFK